MKQLQEREQVLKRIKAEREVRTEKKREWVRKYGESARTGYDLQNPTIPPKGMPCFFKYDLNIIEFKFNFIMSFWELFCRSEIDDYKRNEGTD